MVAKLIRFPQELGEWLEGLAQRERRTFTAQLLLIVEQWREAVDRADRERAEERGEG